MVREHGVWNLFHVALRHVAPRTIVRRIFALANRRRDGTTLFRVTGETPQSEQDRYLTSSGLRVWVVARDAAEAALAFPVALAQSHGKIVLEKITPNRGVASWRNHQNCYGIIECGTRSKVLKILARLQYASISGLVARRADIVCKPRRKFRRVHDGVVALFRRRSTLFHLRYVQSTRAVTVFTSNRQFFEGRV